MLKILHPNANKPPSPKNKHCIIKTEHNDKKADQENSQSDKNSRVDDLFHPQHDDLCFGAHKKASQVICYSLLGGKTVYEKFRGKIL